MARNFYYGSDVRVVQGSATFAAALVAHGEACGLSPLLIDAYVELDAALQEDYRVAVTPSTRTAVAVARKDASMKAVQRRASALAGALRGMRDVTDAQLLAFGLQPRGVRATAPASTSPPTVRVESVVGRVVTLRIHAWSTEGARKPERTMGAQVYAYVGDEPATDPLQYELVGLATRATYAITFPHDVPSGATAWFCCAWVSRRGVAGTPSQPVRATVTGGMVTAA